MKDAEYAKLKGFLMDFVERASKKGATAEEVEALPAVASVLLDAIKFCEGWD